MQMPDVGTDMMKVTGCRIRDTDAMYRCTSLFYPESWILIILS
jgi:hypothetical protein